MPTAKKSAAKKKQVSFHELFVMKLKALYYTEQQLTKALPKMAKAATDPELRQGFIEHAAETETQASRLEQIFEKLEMKPQKTIAEAVKGLGADVDWMIKNIPAGEVLDAGLIAAGQDVEHYEMAGYGTAAEWAKLMGHKDIVEILKTTLQEEGNTDKKLNKMALSKVNKTAMNADPGM